MSCATMLAGGCLVFLFFFNDTATTEIYTLSLHDALPICQETDKVKRQAERQSPFRGGLFRSEEHTSELQSLRHLVCRLLLEKKKGARAIPLYENLEFETRYALLAVSSAIERANPRLNRGEGARFIPLYENLEFFFNDTATAEIYTLSLHDAFPI